MAICGGLLQILKAATAQKIQAQIERSLQQDCDILRHNTTVFLDWRPLPGAKARQKETYDHLHRSPERQRDMAACDNFAHRDFRTPAAASLQQTRTGHEALYLWTPAPGSPIVVKP